MLNHNVDGHDKLVPDCSGVISALREQERWGIAYQRRIESDLANTPVPYSDGYACSLSAQGGG
jgi:hypothetical protein